MEPDNEQEKISEQELGELLDEALDLHNDEYGAGFKTTTFKDAEVMTNDKGIVIEVGEQTFYVTIQEKVRTW